MIVLLMTVIARHVAHLVYGSRGAALYKLQNKMNHSCRPNAKLLCAFRNFPDLARPTEEKRGCESKPASCPWSAR